MKTLTASVLLFESLIVLLAIPVALTVYDVPAALGMSVGILLIFLCIYVGSVMRKKDWALIAGWVIQALVIATGFVVPTMFFLGLIFALLYFYAIRVGKRGDAIKAARDDAASSTIQGEAQVKPMLQVESYRPENPQKHVEP